MLCFQLKINRVFCSMSSRESGWRRECVAREASRSFQIILEGTEASARVGKRAMPRARDRVDLSNKNNIQLKGNNSFGLIFIVTILYLEPFGQFSVRKFLSYFFYITVSLYCIESECVRSFSSQDR